MKQYLKKKEKDLLATNIT